MKVPSEINKRGVSKNLKCPAKINTKVKTSSKNNLKKDPYVKRGLNAIITIPKEHSHTLDEPELSKFLRPSASTRAKFLEYFNDGMGIADACRYHEEIFQEDNATKPTYRTALYWHTRWLDDRANQEENETGEKAKRRRVGRPRKSKEASARKRRLGNLEASPGNESKSPPPSKIKKKDNSNSENSTILPQHATGDTTEIRENPEAFVPISKESIENLASGDLVVPDLPNTSEVDYNPVSNLSLNIVTTKPDILYLNVLNLEQLAAINFETNTTEFERCKGDNSTSIQIKQEQEDPPDYPNSNDFSLEQTTTPNIELQKELETCENDPIMYVRVKYEQEDPSVFPISNVPAIEQLKTINLETSIEHTASNTNDFTKFQVKLEPEDHLNLPIPNCSALEKHATINIEVNKELETSKKDDFTPIQVKQEPKDIPISNNCSMEKLKNLGPDTGFKTIKIKQEPL